MRPHPRATPRNPPIRLTYVRSLLAASGVLLLGACTQTRYYPFVGANEQQGKGIAARRIVNGIDVWSDGTPPRKYEVIGVVYDSRSGFFRDSILKDVTRKAKQMGGQGILEYQGYAATSSAGVAAVSGASGNMGNSSQFGTGIATSAAYGGAAAGGLSSAGTGQSRWWVIRYLPRGAKSGTMKAR
ncbi:hypothetical protein [Methylacidimicrobium sp. B4]|uniref:hypothetical protein n=1 Tax=Methylacidimicrobium sp. B4 TaxID=2796139 RepID=UPI001A8CB33A|nr:hypothetical protein [Methylacidimicrobium sp. B4]QSR84475.1 hypothetical protein MacB4_09750 [Methylacidimicrobium sp. B4]